MSKSRGMCSYPDRGRKDTDVCLLAPRSLVRKHGREFFMGTRMVHP